jgi:hypothetical protein
MKCIEPGRPTIIRYITLRKLKKRERLLVGSFVGAAVVRDCRRDANVRLPETGHRDPVSFEAGTLLLKEMDEITNWTRLALKLYLGWMAVQFAVNGIVLGWLFTYNGPSPWFASLIYLAFIVWNLVGTIGTVLFYKTLVQSDARIKSVIAAMVGQLDSQDPRPRPQSAVPLAVINLISVSCAVTMFVSLAFWIVLFVAHR